MPGRDAYFAVGYHRQLIVVLPKLDIVAVVTSAARLSPPGGKPSTPRYGFDALLDVLAAAVTSDRARRARCRGDGRSRGAPEGGYGRSAVSRRHAFRDGQGRLRQDLAICDQCAPPTVADLEAR
jgi:hypothetical protein